MRLLAVLFTTLLAVGVSLEEIEGEERERERDFCGEGKVVVWSSSVVYKVC